MKIKLLFDRNEGKAGDMLEVNKHITRSLADRLIRTNNATEITPGSKKEGKNVSRRKRVRTDNES